MKKLFLLIITLFVFQFNYAQKKELKSVDKLLKSGDFIEAKASLELVSNMITTSDDKTKAKFYYLKGLSNYQNGDASFENKLLSIKSFNTVKEIEENTSKLYTTKIEDILTNLLNSFVNDSKTALENKNYEQSYRNYEAAYRVSAKDTLYLRNAALVANEGKFYDVALQYYLELVDLGFTGLSMLYKAVEIESGIEQNFQDKKQRDIAVDYIKTHINPTDELSESVEASILRTIAAIYKDKGELDNALSYLNKAKVISPEDINIILLESIIRYDMGDEKSYLKLIEKALSIDPNNVELIVNQGIVTKSQGNNTDALNYFLKAIEIDPNSRRANLMAAVTILEEEEEINEKMNKLAEVMRTDKDFKMYDSFKDKKKKLYRKSIPFLEKVFEIDPNDIDSVKTLKNIYQYLDDSENVEKYESVVTQLENK